MVAGWFTPEIKSFCYYSIIKLVMNYPRSASSSMVGDITSEEFWSGGEPEIHGSLFTPEIKSFYYNSIMKIVIYVL